MFSRTLPVVFCLILLISNISTRTAQPGDMVKRANPDALFTDCKDAVIKEGCNTALDELWNNGKIKRFTTEHQFVTHPSGCKITWWSDGGVVRAGDNQKGSLQNALQQIDDACTSSGLSSVYDSNKKGNGAYVGKLLGNQYLVIMAETGAQ
ncbi:hypothetical protein BY996DRAFT_1629268 [Phakopsora pachyrhizi]|nr:hypothetical protein BY996DRAFT_1629268 [Phakopsora pachyrhizi]